MDFLVARQPSGSRTMTITSTAGSASLEVNDTGLWSDYTTVSATIPLAAGSQTYVLIGMMEIPTEVGVHFTLIPIISTSPCKLHKIPYLPFPLRIKPMMKEIPLQVYR